VTPPEALRAEHPLDRADLRARVGKALDAFVSARRPTLETVSDELVPVADALADFLAEGGKRVRPAFCYWGWRGAGGADCDEIIAAAAALELLHACALIHDDVIDGSDRRRGRASVHRRFAALHRMAGWQGDPDAFGEAAAILLGDLCLTWSDQLLADSGLPSDALRRGSAGYDVMRTELMAGQYLDLLGQVSGEASVDRALRVARFKTAKYTVERPLLLGAALAGAPEQVRATYTEYGVPLGEAFQLRDDVLGVFGDPGTTGKPAGDDLREGKRTVLVATAIDRAGVTDEARIRRWLGDPGLDGPELAALRGIIVDTGALDEVEGMVAELTARALDALVGAPIEPEAGEVLAELAIAATARLR